MKIEDITSNLGILAILIIVLLGRMTEWDYINQYTIDIVVLASLIFLFAMRITEKLGDNN